MTRARIAFAVVLTLVLSTVDRSPLRAADDFADAGNQHVHGGHGFAVVIQAHVERFDFARVIEDGDG